MRHRFGYLQGKKQTAGVSFGMMNAMKQRAQASSMWSFGHSIATPPHSLEKDYEEHKSGFKKLGCAKRF